MAHDIPRPLRIVTGHIRIFGAILLGLVAWAVMPADFDSWTRPILAWNIGAIGLLAMVAWHFATQGSDADIARTALRQEEGEWTMFTVTLAAVGFCFLALGTELTNTDRLTSLHRNAHIAIVCMTLFVSWLTTHVVFAIRYAHEFYTPTPGHAILDGGLIFPGDELPDYWDFLYFSLVLGMTFQVSDVQITSRKLRRLATVHGLIGFLFNTVIVALTVNLIAGA